MRMVICDGKLPTVNITEALNRDGEVVEEHRQCVPGSIYLNELDAEAGRDGLYFRIDTIKPSGFEIGQIVDVEVTIKAAKK